MSPSISTAQWAETRPQPWSHKTSSSLSRVERSREHKCNWRRKKCKPSYMRRSQSHWQGKKIGVMNDTSTNLLCSWCGVSMPQTSIRCSTSWGNSGFREKFALSPWWILKYLFNMPVTPGKVLLGEGMLLLACCGYIRKVNFIFRNSKKNGMECQGLCFPCGKHNPIVHFYGKRSIKKGMEFLQYSGAHRIIHRKTAFQMPPKCRDRSRGYALLLTARNLPQTAL